MYCLVPYGYRCRGVSTRPWGAQGASRPNEGETHRAPPSQGTAPSKKKKPIGLSLIGQSVSRLGHVLTGLLGGPLPCAGSPAVGRARLCSCTGLGRGRGRGKPVLPRFEALPPTQTGLCGKERPVCLLCARAMAGHCCVADCHPPTRPSPRCGGAVWVLGPRLVGRVRSARSAAARGVRTLPGGWAC